MSSEAFYNAKATEMPEFRLDRALTFTPYLGLEQGKPLLIAFSSFMSSIVEKHYASHGISNLSQLYGTLDFPVLHFFSNFPQFNILHVLDEYQVWGLLNTSKYITSIKNIINTVNPSKIITFGSSAGGFQSLLYGELLNADLSIACSPQTIAFHSFMNKYRTEINSKYSISLLNYCYLPKIIRTYNTKTKKVIFLSSGNENDVWHYNLLKGSSDKISCIQLNAGAAHNLFDFYGNKFMREQIITEINKIL